MVRRFPLSRCPRGVLRFGAERSQSTTGIISACRWAAFVDDAARRCRLQNLFWSELNAQHYIILSLRHSARRVANSKFGSALIGRARRVPVSWFFSGDTFFLIKLSDNVQLF